MAKDKKIEEVNEEVQKEELQDQKEQMTEESIEDPEGKKEEPKQEETCTVFGKIDKAILDRRAKRAKQKAEKKPEDKAKKAAMIGGGIAVTLGILGIAGKHLLGVAERYAEDEQPGTVEAGNCEVIPELPAKTEAESVPEEPEKEPEKKEKETK